MTETRFEGILEKAAQFCEQNATLVGLLVIGVSILLVVISARSCSESSQSPTASRTFTDYYISCKEMTKSLIKYPSSFDTPFGDVVDASDFYDRTGSIVRVHFSAKNAFGMKIAGVSRCKVVNNQLVLADAELEDGTRIY
jgi:hypothetical protein